MTKKCTRCLTVVTLLHVMIFISYNTSGTMSTVIIATNNVLSISALCSSHVSCPWARTHVLRSYLTVTTLQVVVSVANQWQTSNLLYYKVRWLMFVLASSIMKLWFWKLDHPPLNTPLLWTYNASKMTSRLRHPVYEKVANIS